MNQIDVRKKQVLPFQLRVKVTALSQEFLNSSLTTRLNLVSTNLFFWQIIIGWFYGVSVLPVEFDAELLFSILVSNYILSYKIKRDVFQTAVMSVLFYEYTT